MGTDRWPNDQVIYIGVCHPLHVTDSLGAASYLSNLPLHLLLGEAPGTINDTELLPFQHLGNLHVEPWVEHAPLSSTPQPQWIDAMWKTYYLDIIIISTESLPMVNTTQFGSP